MPVLEALGVTFAAISAAKDAIDLWAQSRDRRQVAQVIEHGAQVYINKGADIAAARSLMALKPFISTPDILDIFKGRVDACSDKLKRILVGDHPDRVLDDAMTEYKYCVCRELNRIRAVENNLPPEWQQKWVDFQCDTHPLSRL